MKALILAAGRGKRLGVLSDNINKCMTRVRGRQLISYSFDYAAAIPQISSIVVVVGYRADDIIKTFGYAYKGKKVAYVRQKERHGLVHAIEQSRDAIGKSDFMLMLGDELMMNPRHAAFVRSFQKSGVFALCGVVLVRDTSLIRKTYTVIRGAGGRVFRLIEKPGHVFNNMMGTGNCIFKNAIFSYIPKTPINQKRHEKELPDLIQCAVDEGNIVKTFAICTAYVNVNYREELKATESCFFHLS